MDLITTPAHPNANSYISIDAASTYFNTYQRVPYSNTWNNLTNDQKKFALVLAAKALNTFNYKGKKVTKTQTLAFPRYSYYQINKENKSQYKDFFWATRTQVLDTLCTSQEIKILDNKLYDVSSSADLFYNLHYNGYIDFNQVIKQSGLSCDTYLTVDYIDPSGEYLTIKETIEDESEPSSGVDLYATPLFGYPEEVGQAQAEIAMQVINTNIFQADINELPEPQPKRLELGGTLSVHYKDALWGNSKFSTDKANSLDIVYLLLGDWLSSTGGRLV